MTRCSSVSCPLRTRRVRCISAYDRRRHGRLRLPRDAVGRRHEPLLDGRAMYPEPTRAAIELGNPAVYPPFVFLLVAPFAAPSGRRRVASSGRSCSLARRPALALAPGCARLALLHRRAGVGSRPRGALLGKPLAADPRAGRARVAVPRPGVDRWAGRRRGGRGEAVRLAADRLAPADTTISCGSVGGGVGRRARCSVRGRRSDSTASCDYPDLLGQLQDVYAERSLSLATVAGGFGASVGVAVAWPRPVGASLLVVAAWVAPASRRRPAGVLGRRRCERGRHADRLAALSGAALHPDRDQVAEARRRVVLRLRRAPRRAPAGHRVRRTGAVLPSGGRPEVRVGRQPRHRRAVAGARGHGRSWRLWWPGSSAMPAQCERRGRGCSMSTEVDLTGPATTPVSKFDVRRSTGIGGSVGWLGLWQALRRMRDPVLFGVLPLAWALYVLGTQHSAFGPVGLRLRGNGLGAGARADRRTLAISTAHARSDRSGQPCGLSPARSALGDSPWVPLAHCREAGVVTPARGGGHHGTVDAPGAGLALLHRYVDGASRTRGSVLGEYRSPPPRTCRCGLALPRRRTARRYRRGGGDSSEALCVAVDRLVGAHQALPRRNLGGFLRDDAHPRSWAIIGFDGFLEYPALLQVLQDVYAVRSFSLATIAAGFGTSADVGVAIATVAGLALLAFAGWLAQRPHGDVRSFAVVIAACVMASPVVWPYYFSMLFIPIAIAWRRLAPAWFFGYAIVMSSSYLRTPFRIQNHAADQTTFPVSSGRSVTRCLHRGRRSGSQCSLAW